MVQRGIMHHVHDDGWAEAEAEEGETEVQIPQHVLDAIADLVKESKYYLFVEGKIAMLKRAIDRKTPVTQNHLGDVDVRRLALSNEMISPDIRQPKQNDVGSLVAQKELSVDKLTYQEGVVKDKREKLKKEVGLSDYQKVLEVVQRTNE